AANLIEAAGGRTLTEREAKEVLALYGIPVVGERVALNVDEAVNAAALLGYPVVLKVESPDLPHKTEAGVVRLNLRNADEVRTAYELVIARAGSDTSAPDRRGPGADNDAARHRDGGGCAHRSAVRPIGGGRARRHPGRAAAGYHLVTSPSDT